MKSWQRAAVALLNRRRWARVSDAELLERARTQRAELVADIGEDAVVELERASRTERSEQ